MLGKEGAGARELAVRVFGFDVAYISSLEVVVNKSKLMGKHPKTQYALGSTTFPAYTLTLSSPPTTLPTSHPTLLSSSWGHSGPQN